LSFAPRFDFGEVKRGFLTPYKKYKPDPPDLKEGKLLTLLPLYLIKQCSVLRFPAIMISNQKIIITSKRRGDMKPLLPKY